MPASEPVQRRRGQQGYSLIELMIAMLLGLLITAAVIQMFISSRETYGLNEQLSRVQENGRIALDILTRRIRMAGYYGCVADASINSIVDVEPDAFGYALQHPLEGFEAQNTAPGDTAYPLPAANPEPSSDPNDWDPPLDEDLVGRVLPGSDVVALRNLSTESVGIAPPFISAAGQGNAAALHVAESSGYQEGQIVAASDCQKASVFQITNVNHNQSTVVHSQSGTVVPGNHSNALGQAYVEGSEVAHMEVWAFYVGQSSQPEGGPALFQRRLNSSGQLISEELIEGVENMQVLYGVDETGNGVVDDYVTAADLGPADSGGWNNVVGVRVALLLRSPDEYGSAVDTGTYRLNELPVTVAGDGDRRYRQVFTTTIGIRNRLP